MKKILFSLLVVFSISGFAKEEFTVYTYHNHAPFITDKKQGMSYELIDFLNKNSNGDFSFKLKIVPRNRLNYILKPWKEKKCNNSISKKCNKNWMVLWVNHKWGFGSDSLTNFTWVPLFKDSNIIISANKQALDYTNPKDLIGKKIAGMSGHKYLGIDDLVKEGKITRVNGNTEVENLKVVLSKRVDATILPMSAFKYYKSQDTSFDSLYISETTHQNYMRNIMTTPKNENLIKYLNTLDFSKLSK